MWACRSSSSVSFVAAPLMILLGAVVVATGLVVLKAIQLTQQMERLL